MAYHNDIRVAIIGAGERGLELIAHCLEIPNVRFRAVCDIAPYARDQAAALLDRHGQKVEVYEDYREMLAKSGDFVEAVLIATPDSFHAEQTIACLESSHHVYCESEMHTTIAGARKMAETAALRKRLLQIGRQYRSNPRYRLARELLRDKAPLGRIVDVFGQWHGHGRTCGEWPAEQKIDAATLKRYGYNSMDEYRNWRWFEKFSAGDLANLGSHQIDIFNWFLDAAPRSVMASGGRDYYDTFELYDNAQCIFTWDGKWEGKVQPVRGHYDLQTALSDGGSYEVFSGEDCMMGISADPNKGGIYDGTSHNERSWEEDLSILDIGYTAYTTLGRETPVLDRAWKLFRYGISHEPLNREDIRYMDSQFPRLYRLPPAVGEDQSATWHHLKNFFGAVRGEARLNCPHWIGYEGCVSVLKAVEAMKAGRRLELKPEDFTL